MQTPHLTEIPDARQMGANDVLDSFDNLLYNLVIFLKLFLFNKPASEIREPTVWVGISTFSPVYFATQLD